MLTGRSLIYFGPGPWQGLWRNRHQLMTRFARHNRVLYVEPPPYLRSAARQLLRHRMGWQELQRPRLNRVQDGLHVYHSPAFAPITERYPLSAVTRSLRRILLLHAMRQLGMSHPIIWLSRPEMGDLLGQFDEQLSIYHVVDEYTAYQGVSQKLALALRQKEEQLLSCVDLVIVVSRLLWDAKHALNPHTYLVPNGVDWEAFRNAHVRKSSQPADLTKIPEPRLIYAGLIGARLDLALLVTLAQRRPDWSLVLMGEVDSRGSEDELVQLRGLSNVHFLGVKPADQVPSYLMSSQVCLLPYRQGEECRHIDPLKLYEGLAAGKPVVSTPIPAVTLYGDLVCLASDAYGFEAAVHQALAPQDDETITRRRTVAAANTWEARVDRIAALIELRLDGQVRR